VATIFYLYSLSDPRTPDLIRYIGITKYKSQRYYHHLKSGDRKKSYKECWIYSLLEQGIKPEFNIIKQFNSPDDAYNEEQKLISEYKSNPNYRLTNDKDGGYNANHSETTIEKLKTIWDIRTKNGTQMIHNFPHSEEAKRKMSKSHKGCIPWNVGIPTSEGTKKKQSLSKIGKSTWWTKGKLLSDDHKRKLKENHKGFSGRTHSEETKRKISVSEKQTKKRIKEVQNELSV
jgi:hypothetical protein